MKEIADSKAIERSIVRMAHEIIEKNEGSEHLVLVGIKTRGACIAERLAKSILEFEGVSIPTLAMDISYWRDDERKKEGPIPSLPFDITDKIMVIVDDVLYSGRTVRACMDGLVQYGRPQAIQLAVLVDRGHRELPIRPDFIGKNIPTSSKENVVVHLVEKDQEDKIYIEG